MKVFLWRGDGVLQDWTSGMAVAVADNVDEARQAILEDYRSEHDDPKRPMSDIMGLDKEPEVFEINGPIGFQVWGGA